MNKLVAFGITGMLLLCSMHIHADAMDKGFAGASQAQSGAQTKSMRSAAPQFTLSVALLDSLPENPQCGSVGQPCVEKEPANTNDKEKTHGKD